MFSFTPKTGTFAGKTVFTNKLGAGVFTKTTTGNQQHVGTVQTPKFRSEKHFASWVHAKFDVEVAS